MHDNARNEVIIQSSSTNTCHPLKRHYYSQMVGQLMLLTSPLLGAVADHYGSQVLMNLLGLSGTVGLVFLLISVQMGIDWMLFPAFIGMGLMAMASSVMTVKTSLQFEGPWISRFVHLLDIVLRELFY